MKVAAAVADLFPTSDFVPRDVVGIRPRPMNWDEYWATAGGEHLEDVPSANLDIGQREIAVD